MEDHVHRKAEVGEWVLINARWYKPLSGSKFHLLENSLRDVSDQPHYAAPNERVHRVGFGHIVLIYQRRYLIRASR